MAAWLWPGCKLALMSLGFRTAPDCWRAHASVVPNVQGFRGARQKSAACTVVHTPHTPRSVHGLFECIVGSAALHVAVLLLKRGRGFPGGLLGARGVAADSCLYGETYALRTVRARYPNSPRAQQAVQYYLGGGPALTGPQARARAWLPSATLGLALQSGTWGCEGVSSLRCCSALINERNHRCCSASLASTSPRCRRTRATLRRATYLAHAKPAFLRPSVCVAAPHARPHMSPLPSRIYSSALQLQPTRLWSAAHTGAVAPALPRDAGWRRGRQRDHHHPHRRQGGDHWPAGLGGCH